VSDYIVIRIHPDLVGFVPEHLDGMWLDKSREIYDCEPPEPPDDGSVMAVAVATGRFEVRDYDGAVAEVYEFQP